MKVLLFVIVLLINFNLIALSNVHPNNSNPNLTENITNKFSVMENCEPYTKQINTNYTIKFGEKLNVYNLNGSIKFIGWNRDYIKIIAVKRVFNNSSDLHDIHMTLNTLDGLTIETVNITNDTRARIDYIINVPKDIFIEEVYSTKSVIYKNLPNDIMNNARRLSHR